MRPRISRLLPVTAALAAILVVATGCGSPAATPSPVRTGPVAQTTEGLVLGTAPPGHEVFRGIPYAAAPVGEGRWRSPRPPAPWTGVRDATVPGPTCPQTWPGPDGAAQFSGTEDCLFLNVDTPSRTGARPVMVFLHGGGFTGGSGAPYDSTRIVTRGDVVVVTLNYRLGALGFLDHPGLDDPAAGAFGIADQQAALRWVQRNIAAFGGDPADVTLWGESAGAFSTCAHLASPGARALFTQAIVQSGPCANPLLDRAAAHRRSGAVAASLGCPDPTRAVSCLRALPFEALVGLGDDQTRRVHRTIAELPWLPVSGTPLLPEDPLDAITAGRGNPVPLLAGGTRDEMRLFVAGEFDAAGRPLSAEQYPGELDRLFGPAGPRVAELYPAADHPSPGIALATALSDEGRMLGACTQPPFNDAVATRAPVYSFEFARPMTEAMGGMPLGAAHGADVPFLFDSAFPGAPPPARTPAEDALAGRLIDYLTGFARTGRPAPDWAPWPEGRTRRITDGPPEQIDLRAAHRCAAWDHLR